MMVWKMIFLFNWVILRFHVYFQGHSAKWLSNGWFFLRFRVNLPGCTTNRMWHEIPAMSWLGFFVLLTFLGTQKGLRLAQVFYMVNSLKGNLANPRSLHPWHLLWNIRVEVWKMIFLCKSVIFRFHVNFTECNHIPLRKAKQKTSSICLNWSLPGTKTILFGHSLTTKKSKCPCKGGSDQRATKQPIKGSLRFL